MRVIQNGEPSSRQTEDSGGCFTLTEPPSPLPARIRQIELGRGKRYFVRKAGEPWAEIQVNATGSPFDAALIFGRFCCVEAGDRVYFVDLCSGEIREMEQELYFGYYYVNENDLYIASASRLCRLNRDCRLIWRSAPIAIDGVIVEGFAGDTVEVSCEMDPPGGWISRRLSVATGEELTG